MQIQIPFLIDGVEVTEGNDEFVCQVYGSVFYEGDREDTSEELVVTNVEGEAAFYKKDSDPASPDYKRHKIVTLTIEWWDRHVDDHAERENAIIKMC